jgi:hypothetical protein
MATVTEPDQLPAGEAVVAPVMPVGVVGIMVAAPPPQPATLTIITMTETSLEFIRLRICEGL